MNIPRTASLVVALIILLAALGSVVDGDIKLKKNTGGVQVSDSTIQGDMKVEQNTGGVTLRNNETEGDLKCKSNSPSPAGSGNNVGGDRVGPCEVLIESLFALDLVASSDSGRSDTDNITNDNTPTVVGEADPGILVRLYVDGVLADQQIAASQVSLTSFPLADGPHEFTATLQGSDGIEGELSPPLTVVIDTDAPAPPDLLSLTDATDSGASPSDEITNIAAPTVEGQAETKADVQLFVDCLLVGQAGAGSAWQIPIPPRLMAFMMCLPPPRTWLATSANPL